MQSREIITIIGPTASGKTAIATQLSYLLGGAPILSGDSRQVYRGMDIGTGKDLSEYSVNGYNIPYYLIDIADAGERYNLHQYLKDAHYALENLSVHKTPILCGGTGLYIEALIKGYTLSKVNPDHELRNSLETLSLEELQKEWYRVKPQKAPDIVDPENPRRLVRAIEDVKSLPNSQKENVYPPISGPIFCIDIPREIRRERITSRLKERLRQGMIDEVKGLLDKLGNPSLLTYYGLEYRYITEYLIGLYSEEDMVKKLETAIHQFAKRQMTWIRGMERRGLTLTHITPSDQPEQTAKVILSLITKESQTDVIEEHGY